MFQRLVIALDGSAHAETAARAGALLAARTGAAVTLLHILERHAPATIHGERHLRTEAEARSYLSDVAQRCFAAGARVAIEVRLATDRQLARRMAGAVRELQAGLLVMTTHGPRGWRRSLFGSLAQQVVGQAHVPLLVVAAGAVRGAKPDEEFAFRRMLVAHGGDAAHEPALAAGIELARRCGAQVRLVMIVPTRETLSGPGSAAAQLLPRASRAALEMARSDALAHLHAHVGEVRAQGVAIEMEVLRGDPVDGIIAASKAFDADLVVLGTHGKAGTHAFWEGSVAPRVCEQLGVSALLVPAADTPG